MPGPDDAPALDELADANDVLGWERPLHGRMVDHAAPDDAVQTVPYDPADDPFLAGEG